MKDLLQVVTRGGSGSAARTLGGGLAGFLRRARRFPLLLGAVALLSFVGWDLLSDVTAAPAPRTGSGSTSSSPTPTQSAHTPAAVDTSGRIAYSIDLDDIAGLSPATTPGTAVELWATWSRPITESPRLQRVVRDAILDRVILPITPDGPTVATFLITERDIDELLWADRYGEISATTPMR
jgi:hypothetical protein